MDELLVLPEARQRGTYNQEMSMDNFWLLNPCTAKRKGGLGHNKLGSCLLTLRRSSDLRWRIRKKVMYVQRNGDPPLLLTSAEEVRRKEDSKKRFREENEYGARRSVKQSMTEREVERKFNGDKGKREDSCANDMKLKRVEGECRVENEGSNRWSAAQMEHARKSLVEVMHKMGATWRNPVLRHDLRAEARKRIGNLGLLDHVLKHMVGVIVSDGKERFVRRHNSDGAMEYWLELADLVQIRRGAGITDLCWVPPAGWEPENAGSKCTCQGRCEKIASQLKAEIKLLRSEIEELKSLKETETEKLKIDQFQVQLQLDAVDQAWQEKHESLLIEHQNLQKQLTEMSISFLTLKEEMSLLKEESEKRTLDELAMVVKVPNQANQVSEMQFMQEKVKGKPKKKLVTQKGFRNYNPWGTFLRPKLPHVNTYSPHSTSIAMSAPSQLLMLPSPSPTSPLPLPPPCPAFIYQSLPESQCQNQTQAQSQAVHAEFQSWHLASQHSAEYLSTGMMNFGASQLESDELASTMAPPQMKGLMWPLT